MRKTMKLLFGLLTFSLLFTACKKDKEEDPSIVGKWELYEEQEKTYINGNLQSTETEPIDASDEIYHILEFKADGKFVLQQPNEQPETGLYRIDGNKLYTKDETGQGTEDMIEFSFVNDEFTWLYEQEFTIGQDKYKVEGALKHRRK